MKNYAAQHTPINDLSLANRLRRIAWFARYRLATGEFPPSADRDLGGVQWRVEDGEPVPAMLQRQAW